MYNISEKKKKTLFLNINQLIGDGFDFNVLQLIEP